MSTPEVADARVAVREVGSFRPCATQYRWDRFTHTLTHGYDRDLQLFVVWPHAREHEASIVQLIQAEFTVIARFEVHWSDELRENDFERLYATGVGLGSGKVEDAGIGPFLLLIVEDPEPTYQYRRNVSGYLEPTNIRMARVKRSARETAGGYTVHSSNSLAEFFRDATLLLGPRRVDQLLRETPGPGLPPVEQLHADLIGADGWRDLDEVGGVLRRTAEYLVLRNFEQLPGILDFDPEIDVLAREQLDFAGILNARAAGGSGFVTMVGGRPVTFDVRWVGDGYLDARWQECMLERRTAPADGLSQPRVDDHFFSLLYHATLQKPQMHTKYVKRLRELGYELDLPAELTDRISEDEVAASILDGYLAAHGYRVPRPQDEGVHRNTGFAARLELAPVDPDTEQVIRTYLWNRARNSRLGSWAAQSGRLRAVMRRIRRLRVGSSE